MQSSWMLWSPAGCTGWSTLLSGGCQPAGGYHWNCGFENAFPLLGFFLACILAVLAGRWHLLYQGLCACDLYVVRIQSVRRPQWRDGSLGTFATAATVGGGWSGSLGDLCNRGPQALLCYRWITHQLEQPGFVIGKWGSNPDN